MTEQKQIGREETAVDNLIFLPALLVVLVCAVSLIIWPKAVADLASQGMGFVTKNFGWLYLIFGFAAFVFAMWLAFGRFGNVTLGKQGEKPEYSTFTWVSMMFTAGIGGSLVVWAFAEPIYYLKTPPFGLETGSSLAAEMAHMYPMFHWGIIPWVIYAIPAVPIAYMLYVKNMPQMRMSNACDGVLPEAQRANVKRIIDIFIILGVLGGTATSLGLGVPFMSALISKLFGVADTTMVKLAVLLVWVVLFGVSAYRGLKKGIQVLASINSVLAVLAIFFVLLAGPTIFILNMSTNSLGLLLDNFARSSLWTDPIDKGGFPEGWTIFYWAWWLAYAGMVGCFFGRISRGRTIKQLLLGIIGWGTLGTWTFLAIAGAYALHIDLQGILPLQSYLDPGGAGMSAMAADILATLPAAKPVLFLFILLSLVFYATTMDSSAYVMAGICARNMKNDEEPKRTNRLIWAVLIALITAGVVLTGRLETVKAATILTSLPLIPILIMMCFTLVGWLKQDFPDLK